MSEETPRGDSSPISTRIILTGEVRGFPRLNQRDHGRGHSAPNGS